ncbi:MAG: site-2 protease family protein, partial [Candidatus Aenigmarchaeota archaeon]|nr:site-2 protease family protein [Candidatus Aenigmarchaeota archaeon]
MNNYESLIFLVVLFGLIYIFDRKNFVKEGPLMYIRKIRKGIPFLEKYGTKYKKFFKLFGDAGIIFSFGITGLWYIFAEKKYKNWTNLLLIFLSLASFVFLIGIFENPILAGILTLTGASGLTFFLLLQSSKAIIIKELTVPAVQLALPFEISGAPIFYIPLEYFMSAIFVVVVVHEFSHAFVSIAHNIKVKSVGYGFLAFLPLGFAEPDDKQMKKSSSLVKSRVYSAGSFSNIICSIVLLIAISLLYAPSGFDYNGLVEDMPSSVLPEKGTITMINNIPITGDITFYNTMV